LYYLRLILVFGAVYLAICLIYYFVQELLIFFPEKLPQNYKFEYDAEEVTIENGEAKINGLFFSPEDSSKGVIIYFHGNAGSLKGWGYWGARFKKLGFSTLIIDYRGYGKSTGRLSEKNLYDDALKVFQYAKQRFPDEKIIIMGRSIGTGIAVDLAQKVDFNKLILESPFHNLPGMISMHFKYLPHSYIIKYKFASENKISSIEEPILIMHGTKDDIVPIKSGEILSEAARKENLTFVKIEGGGHNNLSEFPEYETTLDSFLNHN